MNIWNAERAFSGTAINAICTTIRIQGSLDVAALQKSLDVIMRGEDQLRARIGVDEGKPYQYIAPYEHRLFPVFDFTKTDSDGLGHWEDTIAREPIPLVDAPLVDFRIFRQSESEGGIIVRTHHIISDGWSQVLLSNRIAETYLAQISGQETPAVFSPPYRLHVEKEAQYGASRTYDKDVAFWRERLACFEGASAVKECHAAVISPVGRRKTYRLSHMLNHLIHDFCEKYRVAPFAVYYMALAIYLNRVSGATRSAIGVPVFNRVDHQDKSTLGMFVSTLPFLGTIDENWSFAKFNTELTEQWFELLRHQRLPFSNIIELAKQSNPDSGGLFHTVLSYQTSRIYKSEDALVTFSGRWHYSGYQNEHLLIHLSSMEDDYRFSVDYDYLTQIFSERDIDRLHEYLTNILTNALSDPELPIWKLPVIGLEEKGRVLFAFNQTSRPLPHADVPSMLRAAARMHAQRVAIIAQGKRLTYGALLGMAASYARAIDSLCPAGNGIIAICLEKGFPLAAAMVGAAISGNAWLTLATDTPPGRLNEILEDSGAALLICEAGAVAPDYPVPVLEPDTARLFESAPYPVKPCADTAYMVYTSGSTGHPKGVKIGQENLVNLAVGTRRFYGHGAVLSLCSAGFDVFVMECAAALMNGRTIVFPDPGQQEDPAALAALIRDYAVGNLSLPPSRLEAYLREEKFTRAIVGVESIICGGEHFSSELMQALRQYTDASVYNQYGPSETTVAVSCKQLNDACTITIGAPMDNCRFYVLDSHMQPLPVGVFGELYIGGLCVGQGYRNLPELTQERFLPSPFELGETLYRSGDMGCWTNDGEIVLGGRMDGQVKLRGLRIEPQEIAMRLAAHEKIDQAAVRVVDRGNGAIIVAYYEAEGGEIPEAELTAFLRSYLPSYMLPGAYMRLNMLPVTHSGKIDYLSLPDPAFSCGRAKPRDGAEAELLAIFQRTLHRPDMDVESDYFLFGGDSLTAMEAIASIEQTLGARLSVADLYAYRTARRVAGALGQTGEASAAKPPEIPVMADQTRYPATPTQLSLYFESQKDPASLAYNMPGAFRLPRGLDRGRLLAAFRDLIAGEKLLRTSFEINENGLEQRVWESAAFGLDVLDGAHFDAAAEAFLKPFDVTRPPLLRAALWDSPAGESYLFVDTHHLIGDGLTSPLLMKKLDALYNKQSYTPGVSFGDYALWRAKRGEDGAVIAHWKEKLANMPALPDLPLDRRESAASPYPGGKQLFALCGDVSGQVDAFCASAGVSPFMLFASAFALMLHKLTGEQDLVFGTPVSGRTSAELWEVCGPFIRTLPLRMRLTPEMRLDELVEAVRRETLEMLENQDVSFDALLKAANGDAGGRIFNSMFSMRPDIEGDFTFLGETLSPVTADTGFAKFPLSIEAAKQKQGYSFTLEYATSLLDEATASLWARSYRTIVEAMLVAKDARLCDIDSIDAQDRYDLFDVPDRRRTPFADIPLDFTISHAARRTPDAPAVRFHGETTTYAALMQRAQGIACSLAALGAKRGDVIGLVHARTPDMLAALLGIMKAGCVYMPALLDYPVSRLAYMAETADAKLILADSAAVAALEGAQLPCPVCAMDQLPDAPAAKLPTLLERSGEDGIYILFTSGTTGAPKGALNTHAAIANLLDAMTPIIGAQAKTVLCSTNITFDIFITESLLALALGKCVALADEQEMLLPHELARLIEAERVDTAQLTPSRLQMCMGSDAFVKAVSRLGAMILVGEPLTLHLTGLWRAATKAKLHNMYGPTEAAVYVSGIESSGETARITIGWALGNCRLYVLDAQRRRVMPTARGEIYLAGVCLAKGYVKQKELTDAAFVPDPFFPGARMYKSGDFGRLLPDGTIEFLGRRDAQVKINGQRVEPEEVTARLLALPGVAEAVTIAVLMENGEKRLRAVVVAADGTTLTQEGTKQELAASLPAFLVPAEIVLLPAMPRNASGKIDLVALSAPRAPEAAAIPCEPATEAQPAVSAPPATPEVPAAAPRRPIAQVLPEIWQEVLKRAEIDLHATFFEQGGSSLSALDAISRYYNAGYAMTLAQFYANPNLDAQIALLRGGIAGEAEQTQEPQPETPTAATTIKARVDTAAMITERPLEAAEPAKTAEASPEMDADAARPNRPGSGAVLLTGATGFLGAHLVDALARGEGREVVCIVRGDDPGRLAAVMEKYFGARWNQENAARVRVLRGDIQRPDFGLDPAQIKSLTGRVDTLLHCAADVRHYVADSRASVGINAGGTANAVRLAVKLGAGFAYVSTMSVAGEKHCGIFDESSPPADPAGEGNAYVRGKCAAEMLVRRCAGLLKSTRIFRVGRLVGRESDGMFQLNKESNAFYGLMRGALALETYPESMAQLPMELTPVDACARAIVLLLEDDASTYHVFNPVCVPFAELIGALSDNKPAFVEDAVFDEAFLRRIESEPSPELVMLFEFWAGVSGGAACGAHPEARATCDALAKKGFVWRRADVRTALRAFMNQ